MKTIGNKETTEKLIILVVILTMFVLGTIYREDFSGQRWAAVMWFGVLVLAASRLIYFLIRKK
jgi:hypothetical protein